MGEEKCDYRLNSKDIALVIGGIIAYELAIIIFLLVLILMDNEQPCCNKNVEEELE